MIDLKVLLTKILSKLSSAIYITHSGSSTTNGYDEYWKYSDGTLICAKYISTSVSCNTSWGDMYYSSQVQLGDWPVEFVNTPYVTLTPGLSDVFPMALKSLSKTNAGNIGFARPVSSSNTPIYIYAIGIGQWK